MSVEQMRHAIANVYQSAKWRYKISIMSDGQVIAIYHKFLAEKKFK